MTTPKPDAKPRNVTPGEIGGQIRERAENILMRLTSMRNVTDAQIADGDDATAICNLIEELDSALLHGQLEASLERFK